MTKDMTGSDCLKAAAMALLGLVLATPALADATSHTPKAFQSGTYVEVKGTDFCSDQTSEHECASIKVRNRSRGTLDLEEKWRDTGSASSTGALDGLQVFELPGCVSAEELPSSLTTHMAKGTKFTRRTSEHKYHYWKPGHDKTIKVLRGCSYAVAVKRHVGQHHWHFTYVPPSAKNGCELTYKYITSKADLHKYEQFATFGAVGGGGGAALSFGGAASAVMAGAEGAEVAFAVSGVALLAATVAYEAGLWATFGVDQLVRDIDGSRDFVLNSEC